MTSCSTPGANMDDPRGLFKNNVSKQLHSYQRARVGWCRCGVGAGVGVNYVKKVIKAIETVALIFCFFVQFKGFSGSSGPSQSTIFGSREFSSFSIVVLSCLGPDSRSSFSLIERFSSSIWWISELLAAGVVPSTDGVSMRVKQD